MAWAMRDFGIIEGSEIGPELTGWARLTQGAVYDETEKPGNLRKSPTFATENRWNSPIRPRVWRNPMPWPMTPELHRTHVREYAPEFN